MQSGFDVLSCHKEILKKLDERYNNLHTLRENLKDLEWIFANSKNKLEKIEANDKIFNLKKEIKIISDKKEINNYLKKVEPIIEGYKKSIPKKISFLSNVSDGNPEEKKHNLLKFVKLARDYIDIGIINEAKEALVCSFCKSTNFECINDTTYCCDDCSTTVNITDDTYSYKDIDRINLSSRYTYTKDGHFKEAMANYQCIQNVVIPQEIYDMIEEETKKHGISIVKYGEVVNKKDINSSHPLDVDFKNYYTILKIEKGASQKEIKKAYNSLALIYHPDKSRGGFSEEIFKEINKAYETLYDPVKRKKYNEEQFSKENCEQIKPLNRFHILEFLKENGYNDYYADASLIWHTITKTPPPDIRKYEDELLRDFKTFEDMYEKVKDPERQSSLNVNYKLFKLLEHVGHKCKAIEFDLPKTKARLIESDQKTAEVFELVGWTFIPTI